MRRGAWMLVLLGALILTAGTTFTRPTNAAEPKTCPNYTYSEWEQSNEDRWYEGQWVMQRLHYTRTRTDTCDGSKTTERKSEGPFQLWQATPGSRIADVSRPTGTDEPVTGSPLQVSPGVEFRPRLGPVEEIPFDTHPGASPERGAPRPDQDAGQQFNPSAPNNGKGLWTLFVITFAGIVGIPLLDLLRREPLVQRGVAWLVDHEGILAATLGGLRRVGDAISYGWNWVRGNSVGWFATEVVRRIFFVGVGLVYFVGTTIQALGKLVVDGVKWLFVTSWENAKSNWRFITGNLATKRQMLQGFKGKWITGFNERFEGVEYTVKSIFHGIVTTWKRWWKGLGRVFTDPTMSTDDLIQFGEDTGSVAFDALILAEGAGAVVRGIRGLSAARAARLLAWERLEKVAAYAGYGSADRLLSHLGLTQRQYWRITAEAEKMASLEQLLARFPQDWYAISFMHEAGLLKWSDGRLVGLSGTLDPAKTARFIANEEYHRVQAQVNQLRGGLGEAVVRSFMMKEVGFRRWILDFEHSSAKGLDALAEYSDSIVAVEVKNLSSAVGPNDVSRFLVVKDGVPSVNVDELLAHILGRAGHGEMLRAAQAIESGEFVFRIELVGSAPNLATESLMNLNRQMVDGVRIIVISR